MLVISLSVYIIHLTIKKQTDIQNIQEVMKSKTLFNEELILLFFLIKNGVIQKLVRHSAGFAM